MHTMSLFSLSLPLSLSLSLSYKTKSGVVPDCSTASQVPVLRLYDTWPVIDRAIRGLSWTLLQEHIKTSQHGAYVHFTGEGRKEGLGTVTSGRVQGCSSVE